ncbi:MAG: hypothetical protein ACP5H5_06495, partial [Pyrobaculum sp.]
SFLRTHVRRIVRGYSFTTSPAVALPVAVCRAHLTAGGCKAVKRAAALASLARWAYAAPRLASCILAVSAGGASASAFIMYRRVLLI